MVNGVFSTFATIDFKIRIFCSLSGKGTSQKFIRRKIKMPVKRAGSKRKLIFLLF
jgi:hypothetical protein